MLRRTSSRSCTTSWPATDADPAVGLTSVQSMLIVVVLPAPLGPRKPNTSPVATSNSTPLHRLDLVVVLHEAADLDRERARDVSRAVPASHLAHTRYAVPRHCPRRGSRTAPGGSRPASRTPSRPGARRPRAPPARRPCRSGRPVRRSQVSSGPRHPRPPPTAPCRGHAARRAPGPGRSARTAWSRPARPRGSGPSSSSWASVGYIEPGLGRHDPRLRSSIVCISW